MVLYLQSQTKGKNIFKTILIFKAFAGKDIPMPSILLVAETGSDISPELAAQHNIHIVPMHVAFGTDPVDDGSFPAEEIRDYYLRTGKLPTTSGSTPEDFTVVFDAIHAEHPEAHILYLAYSAVTTCSYQSAVIAAEPPTFSNFLKLSSKPREKSRNIIPNSAQKSIFASLTTVGKKPQ